MKAIKKYGVFLVFTIFGSLRNTILFLMFLLLSVSYVVIRMKGVELDYAVHNANKKYKEILILNKELKAQRASIYSAERLRKISIEHKLAVPRQDQVIVIPE